MQTVMNFRRSKVACSMSLLACSILLAGCAGIQKQLPELPRDISQERKQRNAEVARHFEQERNRAQIHAATSRWTQGDLQGAREQVFEVLARDPHNGEAKQFLAQIDTANAHSSMEHVAGQGHAPVFGEHGNGYAGQYAQPVSRVAQSPDGVVGVSYSSPPVVDRSTEAAWVNQEAVRLLRSSQPNEAAALIARAISGGTHSAELYRTLSLAHYRQGNYGASQHALQQALSLDNMHPLSYFLMGFTLTKLDDTPAANWHFARAAELDPRFRQQR